MHSTNYIATGQSERRTDPHNAILLEHELALKRDDLAVFYGWKPVPPVRQIVQAAFAARGRFKKEFERVSDDPTAAREAINVAHFRNQKPFKDESALIKARLLRMIDQRPGNLTPEHQSLIVETVRATYDDELGLYANYGLYNPQNGSPQDVLPPRKADVINILLSTACSDQINALMAHPGGIQIQLEALTSFEHYIAALNKNKKVPGQQDVAVEPGLRELLADQDAELGIGGSITGWRVGLTPVQHAFSPVIKNGSFGYNVREEKYELFESGLRLPHPRRYALQQMRALAKGTPLDTDRWSVLTTDTLVYPYVPGGRWQNDRIEFFGAESWRQYVSFGLWPETLVNAA